MTRLFTYSTGASIILPVSRESSPQCALMSIILNFQFICVLYPCQSSTLRGLHIGEFTNPSQFCQYFREEARVALFPLYPQLYDMGICINTTLQKDQHGAGIIQSTMYSMQYIKGCGVREGGKQNLKGKTSLRSLGSYPCHFSTGVLGQFPSCHRQYLNVSQVQFAPRPGYF